MGLTHDQDFAQAGFELCAAGPRGKNDAWGTLADSYLRLK